MGSQRKSGVSKEQEFIFPRENKKTKRSLKDIEYMDNFRDMTDEVISNTVDKVLADALADGKQLGMEVGDSYSKIFLPACTTTRINEPDNNDNDNLIDQETTVLIDHQKLETNLLDPFDEHKYDKMSNYELLYDLCNVELKISPTDLNQVLNLKDFSMDILQKDLGFEFEKVLMCVCG
ncbi:hypothetical protein FQR65_LT05496 [Abscondita terminalis]|nr:hypothetical protein FQR65_LT05496 [Abscondita terminalis]